MAAGAVFGMVVGLGLASEDRRGAGAVIGALLGGALGLIAGVLAGALTGVLGHLLASPDGILPERAQLAIPAVAAGLVTFMVGLPLDPLFATIPAIIATVIGALAGPAVEKKIRAQ